MIQIRKCETFRTYQASEAANLEPEKFRNISIPYLGNTEEDFLNYIYRHLGELTLIWNELDEFTKYELSKLYSPQWNTYYETTWDFEDSWFESGMEDESWKKTGYFHINYSTDERPPL